MKSSFLLIGSLLVGKVSAFVVTPHHRGVAISGTGLCSVKAREKYKKKIAEGQVEGVEEKFLLDSFKAFDKEELDAARKLPEPPTRVAARLIDEGEVAKAETFSEVITNQLLGKYLGQCAKDSYRRRYLINLTTMLQGPP